MNIKIFKVSYKEFSNDRMISEGTILIGCKEKVLAEIRTLQYFKIIKPSSVFVVNCGG